MADKMEVDEQRTAGKRKRGQLPETIPKSTPAPKRTKHDEPLRLLDDIPFLTRDPEKKGSQRTAMDNLEYIWERTKQMFMPWSYFTEETLKAIIIDPEAYTIAPQRLFLFSLKCRELLIDAGAADLMNESVFHRQTETRGRVYLKTKDEGGSGGEPTESPLIQILLDYEQLVLSFVAERNSMASLAYTNVMQHWVPFAKFLIDHALPWFEKWTKRVAADDAGFKRKADVRVSIKDWHANVKTALSSLIKEVEGRLVPSTNYLSIEDIAIFNDQQAEASRRWQLMVNLCKDSGERTSVDGNKACFIQRTELVKKFVGRWQTGSPDIDRPTLLLVYYLVETCSYLWDTLHLSLTLVLDAYLDAVMRPEKITDPHAHSHKLHWLAKHIVELPVSGFGRIPMYAKNLGHCVYDEQYRATMLPHNGLTLMTLNVNREHINSIFTITPEKVVEKEIETFLEVVNKGTDKPKQRNGSNRFHAAGSQLLGHFLLGLYRQPSLSHVTSSVTTLWQLRVPFVKGCMWSISDYFIISDKEKTKKELKEGVDLISSVLDIDPLFASFPIEPRESSRKKALINKTGRGTRDKDEEKEQVSNKPDSTSSAAPVNFESTAIDPPGHRLPLKQNIRRTVAEKINKERSETIEDIKVRTEATFETLGEANEKEVLALTDTYQSWLNATDDASPSFKLLSLHAIKDMFESLNVRFVTHRNESTTSAASMTSLLEELGNVHKARVNAAVGGDTNDQGQAIINDYTASIHFILLSQKAVTFVVKTLDDYLDKRTKMTIRGARVIHPSKDRTDGDAPSPRALQLLYKLRQLIDINLKGTVEAMADDRTSASLMQILEAYLGDQFTEKIYTCLRQGKWTTGGGRSFPTGSFISPFIALDHIISESRDLLHMEDEEGEKSLFSRVLQGGKSVSAPLRENMSRVYQHALYFQANMYMLLELALIALHCIPAAARVCFDEALFDDPQKPPADEALRTANLQTHLFPTLANVNDLSLNHIFGVLAADNHSISFKNRPGIDNVPLQLDLDSFYVQKIKRADFSSDTVEKRRELFKKVLDNEELGCRLELENDRTYLAGNISDCMDILCSLLHPNFEVLYQPITELKKITELVKKINAAKALEETDEIAMYKRLEERHQLHLQLNAQFDLVYPIKTIPSDVWDPMLNEPTLHRGMADLAALKNTEGTQEKRYKTIASASFPRLSWVKSSSNFLTDKFGKRTIIISYLLYHASRGNLRFANICTSNHLMKTVDSAFDWRQLGSSAVTALINDSVVNALEYHLGEDSVKIFSSFLTNVMACVKDSPVVEAPLLGYLQCTQDINKLDTWMSSALLGTESEPEFKVYKFEEKTINGVTVDFGEKLHSIVRWYGFSLTKKRNRPGSVTIMDEGILKLDATAIWADPKFKLDLHHGLRDFFEVYASENRFKLENAGVLLTQGALIATSTLTAGYRFLRIFSFIGRAVLAFFNKNSEGRYFVWNDIKSVEPGDFDGWRVLSSDIMSVLAGQPKLDDRGWHLLRTPFYTHLKVVNSTAALGLRASYLCLISNGINLSFQFGATIQGLLYNFYTDVFTAIWQFAGVALPVAVTGYLLFKGTPSSISSTPTWGSVAFLVLRSTIVPIGYGLTHAWEWVMGKLRESHSYSEEELKDTTASMWKYLADTLGVQAKGEMKAFFAGQAATAGQILEGFREGLFLQIIDIVCNALEFQLSEWMLHGWKGFRWISAANLLFLVQAIRAAGYTYATARQLILYVHLTMIASAFIPGLQPIVLAAGMMAALVYLQRRYPALLIDSTSTFDEVFAKELEEVGPR